VPIETNFNYPSDLNASYPNSTDGVGTADDHVRGIKNVLKTTFPNVNAAINASDEELNYVDGVTSNIQTQIDANAPGWKYLSTVTASGSATADIETTFDSTYDAYVIVGTGITVASGAANSLRVRLKLGGSYVSANYLYHRSDVNSGLTNYTGVSSASASEIPFTDATISSAAPSHANFEIYIANPTSTTLTKLVRVSGNYYNASGAVCPIHCVGSNTATTALTGVRVYANSNITGPFRLYGFRKS
jgi:hypothetical protein